MRYQLPDPTETPFMRPAELASLWGVGKSTVYRWIDDGTVPVVRLGARTTLIPTAQLVAMFGVEAGVAA